MKKIFTYYSIVALLAVFVLAGCKGSKKAKTPSGETTINVPCSGPDYFTNGKVFRANSIGESSDQVASKKKALSNAKAELAANIQTTIKAVNDNYINSREFNNREEIEERFEGLTREVVNQELVGVKTICEQLVRTQEGRYKTYLAIELSADDLVRKYHERLSKDERLRIDYDYEKFKETFDQEMEKFGR